ncbi:hypothetical protein [Polynucleobacter sp. JS-JIR-5-A7]|nr:hypothetical protein [Polynucleobacter sp. JS-JIR-5-A7]
MNNLLPVYSGLAKEMIPGIVKFSHAAGYPAPSMPKDPNSPIIPK